MVYCKLGVLGGWGDPLAEPKWLAGVNKWDQRQSSWQNKYLPALARIRKRQMATTWLLNLKSPDDYISLSEGLLPLIVFHSFHSIWVQALRWCHQPWGGFCSSWMGGLWTATVLTPGWPIIVVGYQDCSKRGYSSKAYFLPLDINYAEDNFSHFGWSQIETEILGITIYVQNSSLQQILLIQSHLPPPHISVQPYNCSHIAILKSHNIAYSMGLTKYLYGKFNLTFASSVVYFAFSLLFTDCPRLWLAVSE